MGRVSDDDGRDLAVARAGHTNEVVDLYAIGFDPVLRDRDAPNWMDESIPQDILDRSNLKQELIDNARGPFRRFLMKRWVGNKDARAIIRPLHEKHRPKDVLEQQRKIAASHALVFIAPVWFVGYPAILKDWIEPCLHARVCLRDDGCRLAR